MNHDLFPLHPLPLFLRAHEFMTWIYFNAETREEEEAAVAMYREIAQV